MPTVEWTKIVNQGPLIQQHAQSKDHSILCQNSGVIIIIAKLEVALTLCLKKINFEPMETFIKNQLHFARFITLFVTHVVVSHKVRTWIEKMDNEGEYIVLGAWQRLKHCRWLKAGPFIFFHSPFNSRHFSWILIIIFFVRHFLLPTTIIYFFRGNSSSTLTRMKAPF